ncbi:hypothetical protein Pukovnik_77 [Mycobacterium phage Pukovnik]|uniref:Uncharacterized protein n=1 Tax=Mycobacterium phage Pukovnik TaxID=2914013 RepID=B3VGM6_9CAUD|nr:site-specific recombination directionality factor RDF [Mycobacterium phage Pukovnik]ACE80003.1 hypothetical protein Pukovnik_77 [Mycobacterium phage Pukovnik]
MKARYILAALVGAIVLGNTPAIIAEARADVSAECWAHLAGVQTAKTPAADRRYHLEHGEFSPCTAQDANEDREAVATRGAAASPDNDKRDHDKKSRYCKKRWFC